MYNHRPFLERRVESVLSQTLQNWEWIVVDDCSKDGSYEYLCSLAQKDRRVTILKNDQNRNTPYSMHRALQLAQGEFLYRMDSDDYCAPRFLERMVGVLESHPSVVMAHCRGLYLDQEDGTWGGWPKKKEYVVSGWDEFRRILLDYHIKSPTLLFRRQTVMEAGGFSVLPLRCAYDWHLSLRACLLGDVAFIDEPLTAHRRHGSNVSGDMKRQVDARQTELETFGVIDEVISHVSHEHTHEVKGLQQAAYRRSASALLPVVRWARANSMELQAEELEQMIEKYVPLAEVSSSLRKPGVRSWLMEAATHLIKSFTYHKLPPVRQN